MLHFDRPFSCFFAVACCDKITLYLEAFRMLFLLLAILSSSMVSIVMRLSSDKVSANLSMLAVNYLFCAWF